MVYFGQHVLIFVLVCAKNFFKGFGICMARFCNARLLASARTLPCERVYVFLRV